MNIPNDVLEKFGVEPRSDDDLKIVRKIKRWSPETTDEEISLLASEDLQFISSLITNP